MARKKEKPPEKNPEILVFDNHENMVLAFVEKWTARMRKAMILNGSFTAALSGGRTPGLYYRAVAKVLSETVWLNSHLFLVDERHVPWEHEDSNWGMLRRELLASISIAEGNLHPVPYEKTAQLSAEKYEKELRRFFSGCPGFPSFDLMVMGLGPDGHTASLFPGTDALKEKTKWCAPVSPAKVPHERITLTYPLMENANEIIFIIQGKDKAERVRDVLFKQDNRYPASTAVSKSGKTTYLLDTAAAELVRELV